MSTDEAIRKRLLIVHGVPSDTRGEQFRLLAREFGAKLYELEEHELDRSIKSIYEEQDHKDEVKLKDESDASERGFVVFCGFNKQEFEGILNAWQKAKLSTLALKAVATEHNQEWPLGSLFKELSREHKVTIAFVALRKQVHQLELALEKRGVSIDQIQNKDAVQSLDEAKNILKDIQAIEEASTIERIHERLKAAWGL